MVAKIAEHFEMGSTFYLPTPIVRFVLCQELKDAVGASDDAPMHRNPG